MKLIKKKQFLKYILLHYANSDNRSENNTYSSISRKVHVPLNCMAAAILSEVGVLTEFRVSHLEIRLPTSTERHFLVEKS